MIERYSIIERFGRNSGIIEAIIERLGGFGIKASKNDVYMALSVPHKKRSNGDAIRAAYEFFDKNWEKIQEEKLQEIAG